MFACADRLEENPTLRLNSEQLLLYNFKRVSPIWYVLNTQFMWKRKRQATGLDPLWINIVVVH